MALAYCIVAYKNPAQIGRLLRSIFHPDNVYFVHYDKRSPRSEHEALARLLKKHPNLHILPPRPVLWGRYSIVNTQLEAMQHSLQLDHPWLQFVTLSGQDFPLKPQEEIVREFTSKPTTSFLSHFDPFTTPVWKDVEERIRRVYLDSARLESFLKIPFIGRRVRWLLGWKNRMPCVPFVSRKKPEWFRYMGGSNHFALSRDAVSYVVTNPNARRIIQWLKHTAIPEESIFQSVLLNSPFANSIINDDRRAIFWERPGASSPITLTSVHYPWLLEAREKGKLFARKFDTAVDDELLCALEKEIGL